MRVLFGVVSLLVALAIVGLVVVKQLKATGNVGVAATASAGLPAEPASSDGGTVREASQALQQKVQDDIRKALEQGAAARAEQADK